MEKGSPVCKKFVMSSRSFKSLEKKICKLKRWGWRFVILRPSLKIGLIMFGTTLHGLRCILTNNHIGSGLHISTFSLVYNTYTLLLFWVYFFVFHYICATPALACLLTGVCRLSPLVPLRLVSISLSFHCTWYGQSGLFSCASPWISCFKYLWRPQQLLFLSQIASFSSSSPWSILPVSWLPSTKPSTDFHKTIFE